MPDTPLQILVRSFSYHKSTLHDASGHGIGFVFDMRAIKNPGRLQEYKPLSGEDQPVKDYLEQETEMPIFLKSIKKTLFLAIQSYLDNSYSHLTINFGCTGGQHRSVYAANKIAKKIKKKFPVKVKVEHLMKDHWVRSV